MTLAQQPSEIATARRFLEEMARDWRGEVPLRIHQSGFKQSWGLGSSPPFSADFDRYIGFLECKIANCAECKSHNRRTHGRIPIDGDGYYDHNQDFRTRTSRALRKLRRHAPLEFDVLYLAVMHGLSIEQIQSRLNERAIAKQKEDRYTLEDVAVLALCGIDKSQRWL